MKLGDFLKLTADTVVTPSSSHDRALYVFTGQFNDVIVHKTGSAWRGVQARDVREVTGVFVQLVRPDGYDGEMTPVKLRPRDVYGAVDGTPEAIRQQIKDQQASDEARKARRSAAVAELQAAVKQAGFDRMFVSTWDGSIRLSVGTDDAARLAALIRGERPT